MPLDLYANLSHDFIKELGFNLKNILPHRKLSLHNFLRSVDKDIASKEQLKNELNGVFAMYENALEADKQRAKNIRSVISSLELDILESGVDFDEGKKADIKAKSKNSKKSKKSKEADETELELMSERIALRFEELREFVGLAELERQTKELHTLKGKMQEALDELIAEIFE